MKSVFGLLVLVWVFVRCGSRVDFGQGVMVLAAEEREGYECYLIEYDEVTAYLLVPDEAREAVQGRALRRFGRSREGFPAVVMLHDHGARFDIGKEKLVRPIAADSGSVGAPDYILRSAQEWVDKNFDGVYVADSLAARGYVVIVPDALYWGGRSSAEAQLWSRLSFAPETVCCVECAKGKCGCQVRNGAICTRDDVEKEIKQEIKRLKKEVYEGQRQVYADLEAQGIVWAEKTLAEDEAAVRLLAGLPFVDAERIGAFGFSMGAHRCWLLSAFCPEIKCGAAVSWMTTKAAHRDDNASDFSMRIPRLRDSLDFPEIARYLAPKPMLFISGREDHLFPEAAVNEAFTKMQAIYDDICAPVWTSSDSAIQQAEGAGRSPLRTLFLDGGHHCGDQVREIVFDFFDKELNL